MVVLAALYGVACQPAADPPSAASPGDDPSQVVTPEDVLEEPPVDPSNTLQRLTEAQVQYALLDILPRDGNLDIVLPELAHPDFDTLASAWAATPLHVETQATLAQHLAWLAHVGIDDECPNGDISGCVAPWVASVADRAWRRPLTLDDRSVLSAQVEAGAAEGGPTVGARRGLEFVFQAPEFLYQVRLGDLSRAEGGLVPLTGPELAARLSLLFWQTIPDASLREDAAEDDTPTAAWVGEVAQRLLADPRSSRMISDFHRQWLELDDVGDHMPDFDVYMSDAAGSTGWQTQISFRAALDARAETLWLATDTILHGEGTVRALLTRSDWAVADVTGRYSHGLDRAFEVEQLTSELRPPSFCAEREAAGDLCIEVWLHGGVYLVPARMEQLPDHRMGLLTTPGFLMAHAGPRQPSPVRRGVVILDKLLCQPPTPPPADAPGALPAAVAVVTNRDRYEAHTAEASCAACHTAIDGLGFPFESYDSMGAWREHDAGLPVDPSGQLVGTDVDGEVADHVALIERLASSRQVHNCVVSHWWRYAIGRHEEPEDLEAIELLQERFFVEHDGHLPSFFIDLVQSEAFRFRRVWP